MDRIPLVDIKMMDTINQKWSRCIAFPSKNAPLSHSLLACIFDFRIYVPSSVRERERGIFSAIPCRRWRKNSNAHVQQLQFTVVFYAHERVVLL